MVTEIRGPQDGPDTRGEWFELYNTTDEVLDLRGLRGVLTNLRGSQQRDFVVRDSLLVEPGAYVVLGSLPLDDERRPELDYSFNADFRAEPRFEDEDDVLLPETADADPRELFANARVELLACDHPIDRVVYAELPSTGTYSFDGAIEPDVDANDDTTRWCTNDVQAPVEGPQTAQGSPGSPGAPNPPCD